MFDHFDLPEIWDRTHRGKSASEQPEAAVIAFAEHVQRQLPPGISLLDSGCGRGRNALYLSTIGFSICACDVSLVALEIARKRTGLAGLSINFQGANITCLPYADDSFTAAICVHVLPYHLKVDIAKGIRELWRVLQPNGWLYIDLLDCEDAEYSRGQRLEEDTFLDSDELPIHFSSRQEINELMNGFALEHVTRNALRLSPDRIRVSWVIWAVKLA